MKQAASLLKFYCFSQCVEVYFKPNPPRSEKFDKALFGEEESNVEYSYAATSFASMHILL
jgi:hypothetical protein